MSKTKEEILRHHFEASKLKYPTENWKDFEEVKIEREFIADAMDEYASQVLSEYKEKLKTEINEITLPINPDSADAQASMKQKILNKL